LQGLRVGQALQPQRAPLAEDVSLFGREQESAFRRGVQRPLDLGARQIDVF